MSTYVPVRETDLFLTHDWGEDEMGRNNHKRVRIINEELNRRGFLVWFDEVMMEGEVIKKMVAGINGTRFVLVFVTRRYMAKINGLGGKKDDNCQMEFEYSLRTKTTANMLCVVMEDAMTKPSVWEDNLLFTMGRSLFVCMNGDLDDKEYLMTQMNELVKQLRMKGITPSQVLKHCLKCDTLGDGRFCHYCGHGLVEISGKAKNYCSDCNTHGNGMFCSNCGKGLPKTEESRQVGITVKLEEFEKLKETETNYHEVVNSSENVKQFKEAEAAYQEKIEAAEKEKKKLREERNELEAKSLERIKALEEENKKLGENVIVAGESPTTIEISKLKLKEAEAAYQEKIEAAEKEKKMLREERTELETKSLERIKTLEEENKKLREKVAGESPTTTQAPRSDDPVKSDNSNIENYKYLIAEFDSCDDKFAYIEKLLKANETNKLASLILARKELLQLRGPFESPIYVWAARVGNLAMVQMLQNMGADVNAASNTKNTALHNAVYRNKPEMVTWMCENTPQLINVKKTDGQTALHLAVRTPFSSVEKLRILLEHGADVTITRNNGLTPLADARNMEKKEEVTLIENWMKKRGIEIK